MVRTAPKTTSVSIISLRMHNVISHSGKLRMLNVLSHSV
jgi:hypothetical protein